MIYLRKEISFYNSVMKNGTSKGQINTFKKKIKFIGRNILFFNHSKKIADFLMTHRFLKNEVYRYPALCSKIHRPYITNFLKIHDKVDIIISSYKFLDNFFNDATLETLYKNGEMKICDVIGKNEDSFSIVLNLYTNFEKEGEFNLTCYNSDSKMLAKMTFAMKGNKIIIGGLQGLEKGEDPEIIKTATKSLYGTFPKKLLIEALYDLFPQCEKIAVGNESHIYLSARYKFKKYRTINADYDDFWESLNGHKEGVMWSLPQEIERKNIEDVPSKKRSMYNNRFRVLDEMKASIDKFLTDNKR
ncbi:MULTISPECIES: DUF535 family protein [unclassified Fusobacterium]|uniref:VirK/YbjX family protein n=2 Tax=unclassified Fusobacterium TaxID=2648384 RepID=UPI0032C45BC2